MTTPRNITICTLHADGGGIAATYALAGTVSQSEAIEWLDQTYDVQVDDADQVEVETVTLQYVK
jgi:hypothetical protein